MSTLTKTETFFNNLNLTCDDDLFVGIDVHKKSYHVAMYLNNAPAIDFNMAPKPQKLIEKLKPVVPAIKKAVYETGPTGYSLVRSLRKNKIPADVIATSKTPRPAAEESKTDRFDSKKLAEFAAKNLLRPVAVPTPRQEANRQLYRMRHRQSRNFAKVKKQIKAFLLMHGIEEPKGLAHWSNGAVDVLRKIHLLDTLRLSLDELLCDYDHYNNRIRTLDKTIAKNLDKGQLAIRMAILKTHPGVGPVIACQFATELFHYKDFGSNRQLYRYLGLSPMIRQSGQSCRTGSINKAANSRLRSNLIQAAWRWVAVDIEAKKCYYRLCNNCGGIKQKAITAMARKLAGHLWAMLMKNQPYDPEKARSKGIKGLALGHTN
jgi:transposase